MPRRRPEPESAEDKAIREVDAEDTDAMNGLALQAGPPPDSDRLSEADEDAAWEFMDPAVDFEQMASLLMTQGIPQEMAQRFLITKLRPDDGWLEALATPTQDAEAANQIVKMAQYPFRLSVLDTYDDPEDQTRKAETLDRRYQRRMAAILDAPLQIGGYGQMPATGGQTDAPNPVPALAVRAEAGERQPSQQPDIGAPYPQGQDGRIPQGVRQSARVEAF